MHLRQLVTLGKIERVSFETFDSAETSVTLGHFLKYKVLIFEKGEIP